MYVLLAQPGLAAASDSPEPASLDPLIALANANLACSASAARFICSSSV